MSSHADVYVSRPSMDSGKKTQVRQSQKLTPWAATRYISLIYSVVSRGICIFAWSALTMVSFQGTPVSLGIHSYLHNKIVTFQSISADCTVHETFYRRGKKNLRYLATMGRSRHPSRTSAGDNQMMKCMLHDLQQFPGFKIVKVSILWQLHASEIHENTKPNSWLSG